jgi:hypothetical protein
MCGRFFLGILSLLPCLQVFADEKSSARKPLREGCVQADDVLQAAHARRQIAEQQLAANVEKDLRKARDSYAKNPDEAYKLLRDCLLRVLDNPDVSERLRDDLLHKVMETRRAIRQDEKELIPPSRKEVHGVIEKIDPKNTALVLISIGSDSGVANGQTLDVYRLKPAPKYLGKIRVIGVTPQRAIARPVGTIPANVPALATGDNVTSLLTVAEQSKRSSNRAGNHPFVRRGVVFIAEDLECAIHPLILLSWSGFAPSLPALLRPVTKSRVA